MTQQRVHHVKYQADESQVEIKIAGRNINNFIYTDDTHPYGRHQRGTKQPLHESERRELKSCLKTQQSKNEDHGIRSHQFSSVTQFCPTFCDPHELQYTRPPCPSPTPGVTHVH